MKTKMIALFAVLVLSVALAGTAYAAWTDQISINGTVTTGTFDITITASGSGASVGDDTATFVINNAYPGMTGTASITISNTGTVPATLESMVVSPAAPISEITWTLGGNAPAVNDPLAAGVSQTFTVSWTVNDAAAEGTAYAFSVQLNYDALTST
jgi:predicted ribosomally synthesized peptide with SipW-like signal peptide